MIIVTGASRGLGKAIAERLLKNGETVIGLARSNDLSSFESLKCDVSKYSDVKKVMLKLKKRKTFLKAFINVAGVASMNMALTTDQDTVQRLLQTNLVGTINCCQLFAPIMLRQREGVFINFSTIAVALAIKGESVYAASKAGVEAFSRTFAKEVSGFNIRVNCIAPGPIKTDLLKGITTEQISKIIENQVIPKQFDKGNVCDLVELLLDPRASSISGQTLNLGGV